MARRALSDQEGAEQLEGRIVVRRALGSKEGAEHLGGSNCQKGAGRSSAPGDSSERALVWQNKILRVHSLHCGYINKDCGCISELRICWILGFESLKSRFGFGFGFEIRIRIRIDSNLSKNI